MSSARFSAIVGLTTLVILMAGMPCFPVQEGLAQTTSPNTSPDSKSLITQEREGNTVVQATSESRTSVDSAFSGVNGIATLNQAAGNLNNQAVVTLLAVSEQSYPPSFAALMTSKDNTLTTTGDVFYGVSMSGKAFAGGAGLAVVNQTSGNLNNQMTVLSVSMGPSVGPTGATKGLVQVDADTNAAVVALSNNRLGQMVAVQNNTVTNNGKVTAEARLEEGAFQDYCGVAVITQVAGNLNQVSSRVGLHVNTMP
jgi:hypothetical protein